MTLTPTQENEIAYEIAKQLVELGLSRRQAGDMLDNAYSDFEVLAPIQDCGPNEGCGECDVCDYYADLDHASSIGCKLNGADKMADYVKATYDV